MINDFSKIYSTLLYDADTLWTSFKNKLYEYYLEFDGYINSILYIYNPAKTRIPEEVAKARGNLFGYSNTSDLKRYLSQMQIANREPLVFTTWKRWIDEIFGGDSLIYKGTVLGHYGEYAKSRYNFFDVYGQHDPLEYVYDGNAPALIYNDDGTIYGLEIKNDYIDLDFLSTSSIIMIDVNTLETITTDMISQVGVLMSKLKKIFKRIAFIKISGGYANIIHILE